MNGPKVGHWTEDALVRSLLRGLPQGPDVEVGPGDDCAVVSAANGEKWLLKTDCVLEGVHFLRGMPARSVGHKALARCVSDFAAMAGTPRWALVTIAVPEDLPVAYLRQIYVGLRQTARRFGISLTGGETSRSPGPIFLSLSLVGPAAPGPILRSGGSPGEIVLVTGRLGGSFASGRHLRFRPRLPEAQWLAQLPPMIRPTALMDLSDGLAADLPRLATASGCDYFLEESKLPRHRGVSVEQALGDGEDYELLLTVPEDAATRLLEQWKAAAHPAPLTAIGRLVPPGCGKPLPQDGFAHFRPEKNKTVAKKGLEG